jgi:hypothetical protein
MIPLGSIPTAKLEALRVGATQRLEAMRGYRLPWWSHWADLAEHFLPRRYRWFVTANNYARGTPINRKIVDETGVLAARTLATGLLANLTSPTKPWFRLGIKGVETPEGGAISVWLAECTRRMLDVYAGSNLYTILGTAYHDLGVFGSAAVIQYEDPEDVVRFYSPCLGEFFFGLDNRLTVDTLYREYTYTLQETVEEFGIDNVSESTRVAYTSGGSSRDTEIVICHAIEPNKPLYDKGDSLGLPIPAHFKFREIFWEQSSAQGTTRNNILRVAGFREKPFVGLRWDVTSNDAYGRSPGMDALPAVRQLQLEQRRKAEAIDKMVRPPMVGSISMKNEPASIMPGGVTYVVDPAGSGFKPAFTVEPRIAEMMEDLREVQSRVNAIFFIDLFRPVMDNSKVQTATWVEAVQQEKLLLLGPVVERTESEGLDSIISRTFAIMSRRGLFPDPPAEIAGMELDVHYISILAAAQRAASTASIERVLAMAGNLVGVAPGAMDNINIDAAISEYAGQLNTPPTIIRTAEAIEAIRAERKQAEDQAAALTTGATLASGAKTLSDTPVGGGQSALDMVLGQ